MYWHGMPICDISNGSDHTHANILCVYVYGISMGCLSNYQN